MKALKEDRVQLDNGRNQAARIRNAGKDYNPHGLGYEIHELLPRTIKAKAEYIRELEVLIHDLEKVP